mmetsp:Transcript_8029/g.11298  ORF Transcript_8029/g.11298 Transcript_8029/m.11298 type:complete len:117 (+) Transcript_8029:636-986(+)
MNICSDVALNLMSTQSPFSCNPLFGQPNPPAVVITWTSSVTGSLPFTTEHILPSTQNRNHRLPDILLNPIVIQQPPFTSRAAIYHSFCHTAAANIHPQRPTSTASTPPHQTPPQQH